MSYRALLFVFNLFCVLFLITLTAAQTAAEEISGTIQASIVDFDDGSHKTVYELKTDAGLVSLSMPDGVSQYALQTGAEVVLTGLRQGDGSFEVSEVRLLSANASYAKAVSGTRTIAIIMVDFDDRANGCSAEQIEEVMWGESESVRTVYEESSRGQLTFASDSNRDGRVDIFGPFTISRSSGSCDSPGGWGEAAQSALEASGVDPDDFQHLIAHIPFTSCGWSGRAGLGCGDDCTGFVMGCSDYLVMAHELGHNLGMHHATSDYDADGTFDSEYGDQTCPMGSAWGYSMFNAPHQHQMGWLDAYPERTLTVTASGVYNIAPLEATSDQTEYPQILRVQSASNEHYYFSYRNNGNTYDIPTPLTDNLSIHKMETGSSPYTYYVGERGIDEGQTFQDASLGLTLCVHDQNNSALNVSVALNGDSCSIASEDGSPGESDDPVPGDSDGDGVSDTQETADGTDSADPGSYLERPKQSSLYALE